MYSIFAAFMYGIVFSSLFIQVKLLEDLRALRERFPDHESKRVGISSGIHDAIVRCKGNLCSHPGERIGRDLGTILPRALLEQNFTDIVFIVSINSYAISSLLVCHGICSIGNWKHICTFEVFRDPGDKLSAASVAIDLSLDEEAVNNTLRDPKKGEEAKSGSNDNKGLRVCHLAIKVLVFD
ncbi:hypothetical protein AKJ16_DCAP01031 [Drosera capensis]